MRRRCADLILFTSAGALATALALGFAPVAGAEQVWDIQAYDDCMGSNPYLEPVYQPIPAQKHSERCCDQSGGVWSTEGPNAGCTAPPAEPQGKPVGPSTGPFTPATEGVSDDPQPAQPPLVPKPPLGGTA